MERLSNRESVLLGYSPQSNITNNHLISSPDSSDIDFHDVFGGPPRRASTQESRYSFGGKDTDSYALTSTSSHRHRWSGLSEKPVFGDDGANRRRYTSHDFFDDVFGGNDYLVSSPRKDDRGSFSSNPGSSPVRRLPSRASEPFASSSVPAQFSLPAKLIKGTDLPTFRSNAHDHHKNKDGTSMSSSYHAHSPLSRFSSQANQVQVESRSDVYIGSFLSRAPSAGSLESSGMVKPDEMDKGNDLKKDQSTSGATSNSNQFHFSIYKWASKGVPLALPIRGGKGSKLKDDVKLDRSSSASGRIVCEGLTKELGSVTPQDTDRPLCGNSISSDAKSFMVKLDKKEKGSLIMTSTTNGRVEQEQTIEEAVLRFEPESQRTDHETVKYNPGVISQDSKEGTKSRSVIDIGKSGKEWQKIPGGTQDARRTELKTLHSLMSATEETTTEKELKESKVKSTKKSAAIFDVGEKAKKQIKERTTKANLQSLPKFSQDSFAKSRSTGKVKEFVKILNQEASNKPTFNIDSESPHNRGSREKERSNLMPKNNPSTNQVDVEVHFPLGNKNHKKLDAFIRVDEFLKQPEEQHSNAETRTNNLKPNVISFGLEGRSAATEASKSDGAGDQDDSFQGNILIKELILDDDEQPQASDNQGDFQVIDAKIRKWSSGKEGNIRSLLSTLQYVLWPGSGWKPVPLVDIIEGNAVRRSYQRALLSLHPDKLQQKGATSHQKYTAEKVFDILQEAWTQFNTLGSV